MANKLFTILAFSLILFLQKNSFAQGTTNSDSILISKSSGSKDPDLLELLRFQKINTHQFKLISNKLNDKKFNIFYVEYKLGKAMPKKDLFIFGDASIDRYLKPDEKDSTLKFNVISQQKKSNLVQIYFSLVTGVSITIALKTKKTNNYLMRDAFSNTEEHKIALNNKTPFLVYAMPYKVNKTTSSYCQLTATGIPPEKWYEKYKIKHYIVFYLDFRD